MSELEDKPKRAPRRILAGFGSAGDEIQTLDAALALARALHAEIAGHFIEEAGLINMASLPFTRIVRSHGRAVKDVGASDMEREITEAGRAWRRRLAAGARRHQLSYSFAVTRGDYCIELKKAASPRDIVIVNPENVFKNRRAALLSALGAAEEAAGAVLIPRRAFQSVGPVVLIASEGAPSDTALQLVEEIAKAENRKVVIITPGGTTTADEEGLETLPFNQTDVVRAVDAINALYPSYLVWQQGPSPELNDELLPLLDATDGPLLILKG
ncbi:MAG: hypothetical protein AAGE61_08710 [Pseudomonadota bacterium]